MGNNIEEFGQMQGESRMKSLAGGYSLKSIAVIF